MSSKGFTVRPLTVLELRGQKLELRLLEIAENEEVDEFIIGLPKSWDGKETPQSNKVRSVAGRFAVLAAHRGWRVYLQDEHGTSTEATNRMIDMGLNKSTRQKKVDAYAAVMVLERYFSMFGEGAELVLPKQLDLQEKLQRVHMPLAFENASRLFCAQLLNNLLTPSPSHPTPSTPPSSSLYKSIFPSISRVLCQ
ncbi:hypothetical protein OIU78_010782 [Salix suchowensis]|nr:hypothetical protein OIU78_010782 [Salix suchowensis]